MATSLDMSLDDMIKSGRDSGKAKGQGRGRSRGQQVRGRGMARGRGSVMARRGPPRDYNQPSGYNRIAKPFSKAKNFAWNHDLFDESLKAAGLTGVETGTKLYISNLDYGVTNEDIKELFSEMGVLKKSTVHYNKNGVSTGTAEVVFMRRSDAVGALKRYNNVQLDGKAMKIEIIGDNLGLPSMPRISIAGGTNGRGRRTVVMMPEFGQGGVLRGGRGGAKPFNRTSGSNRGSFSQRGRGRGRSQQPGSRGGGSGGRGRGRGKKKDMSVEELDKDLDTYHSKAS